MGIFIKIVFPIIYIMFTIYEELTYNAIQSELLKQLKKSYIPNSQVPPIMGSDLASWFS